MHKLLIFTAALAVFVAGCGNRDRAANRPVDKNENPDVLVKNAVESRTALSSIAGRGVMRIVDQPSKFGLTVNADVVADESDRLRIRADKLAGTIQAFDVVKLGDDIGFYIPTQNTLYHGKVRDLQGFSFRFDPDEVLRQMLRPETSLTLKQWRHAEPRQDDPANVIVLEEDVAGNRPRMRVAVNQKNGMLASVTQLDARGQPVFIKKFEDYRNLHRSREAGRVGEDASAFPYMMSFSWPRERRSMEMHFKQVEGNAVVLDEDFDIAASSDTRYLPLQEAQMDPGLGDEPMAAMPREPTNGRPM